ncbi:hypothetical protein BASA81_000907 [Batrachochytrium salamandrivorans]|nr:hypothetical protein BASA81_000907 [Batrachochytrium salamandrivorans]
MERLEVRWRRQTYQLSPDPEPDTLQVEWDLHLGDHGLALVSVECKWRDERIEYQVERTPQELLGLLSEPPVVAGDDLQLIMEACLLEADDVDLLPMLEISKWTFTSGAMYRNESGAKIKEGLLEKASGGYESYNRSRWNVLLIQIACIGVSVAIWQALGYFSVLYLCVAVISLLSLAHWSYYRLDAIDATCVIPCMLLPPVGPFILLAWTLVSCLCQRRNQPRWFVLRPAHLESYSEWALGDTSNHGTLTNVLLLDASTKVFPSRLFPRQFVCQTPFRTLRLWANNRRDRDDWVAKIQKCLDAEHGRGGGVESSFSPPRNAVPIRHLVDGKDTFAAIKLALLGAKREIFIAGWMLSPELYLERGDSDDMLGDFTKLPATPNGLFQTKQPTLVQLGAKYVYPGNGILATLAGYELVVRESQPAIASWTMHGRREDGVWVVLDKQRRVDCRCRDVGEPVRFRVQSSAPCSQFSVTFVVDDGEEEDDLEAAEWTHVERDSFECGGVALFAGKACPQSNVERWQPWWSLTWFFARPAPSPPPLPVFDINSRLDRIIAQKVSEGVKCYIIMYRDMDLFLSNASFYAKRKLLLKSLGSGREGGGDLQILRHAPASRASGSVQHLFSCSLSKGNTWWSHHEKLICVDQSTAFIGGLDLAYGRFDDSRHNLWDHAASVWQGKDYYNAREKDFENLGLDPFTDSVDRETVPRMPWHDVHCMLGGLAAMDIARHFIGRWNAERRQGTLLLTRAVLLPRYPAMAVSQQPILDIPGALLCNCQVLRSVGLWSSPSKVESSILDGYLDLIATAKRSIYIEQQFFSSSLAGRPVKNRIAWALAERIAKACRAQDRFKVVILLPILPAFEGDLRYSSSSRSVLHWNLKTIRGMRRKLQQDLGYLPPARVLGFFSLRQAQANARGRGELHTEPIYIHSKLLIVDDETAIIGSANLNDRSMLGKRDSELAILVRGNEFCQGLRRKLFAEHCGEPVDEFDDPKWDQIALHNTLLLERAFSDIPRDSFVRFPGAKPIAALDSDAPAATSAATEGDVEARAQILNGQLRGHLICFPVHYLSQEPQLLPKIIRGEREGAIPLENFT